MKNDQSGHDQSEPSERGSSRTGFTESQKEKEKSIDINSTPNTSDHDSERAPDVLAFKQTIKNAWALVKSDEFQGPATAISTIAIAFFTFTTWIVILTGSGDTKKAANAADSFSTTAIQIRGDLQKAVSDNEKALADNNKAITDALAENRAEISKALDQNRQSLQSSIAQSKAGLDASISASQLDQRAWLGIGTFQVVQLDDGNLKIDIQTINSGKTPALATTEGFSIRWDPNVRVGAPQNLLDKLEFKPAEALPPQGNHTMHIEMTWKDDLHKLVTDKSTFVSVFGEIKYQDIFRHTTHSTKFCIWLADPNTKLLGFCDTGNDMN